MAPPDYPSPGILFVIIENTVTSISFVKEFIRSALSSVGIRVPSSREDDIWLDLSVRQRPPTEVLFLDEFRRQMPAIPYKSIPALDCPTHDCIICLNEFNKNDKVNRLLCGHVFHESCLEGWLSHWNLTCPLCRNDIIVENIPT